MISALDGLGSPGALGGIALQSRLGQHRQVFANRALAMGMGTMECRRILAFQCMEDCDGHRPYHPPRTLRFSVEPRTDARAYVVSWKLTISKPDVRREQRANGRRFDDEVGRLNGVGDSSE